MWGRSCGIGFESGTYVTFFGLLCKFHIALPDIYMSQFRYYNLNLDLHLWQVKSYRKKKKRKKAKGGSEDLSSIFLKIFIYIKA